MKQMIFVLVAVVLFLGCSDNKSNNGNGASDGASNTVAYLKAVEVTPAQTVRAGYLLSLDVVLETDQSLENVSMVFSAVKSDDQNNSVALDEIDIATVTEGRNHYGVSVVIPRDVVPGDYTVIANVDPDDQLGDWSDETQFTESSSSMTVQEHGPDEIIVTEAENDADDIAPSAQRASLVPSSIIIEANDENISIETDIVIRPNLSSLDATDVDITACLDVGSQCISLPLWSSDGNGTLSNTLTLKAVDHGYDLTRI